MKQLRGPKHENWPVCDPATRALPLPRPGGYGLRSGKNGHLARANGAIDGPYCSPTWLSVFGRRCMSRWLVGVVGLGAELLQCPHAARGALLQSECLRREKRAVSRPSGAAPEGLAGVAKLAPLSPGGPGGAKPLLFAFHNPEALSNAHKKKTLVAHVTRW
jgi:hypothetical protein